VGSALVLAAALFAAWQLVPPVLSEADRQLITQELQTFEEQMARMEIYGPAGGNATETVNRLISIARGKPYPEVQRAAERLADVYLRDAYNSYLRKNFEDALMLVEKGAELAPQHPSLAELRSAIGAALTAQRVADLLDTADAALSQRNFVPPTAGNAYSVFREIESLDPGNSEAETGMREIQLHIAEQARGAWGTEGLKEARMLALRGLELFPDSVLLNDLLADMNRAEQTD
jgi:hypothetical protein